jgi:DNA-binding transcriptional ArsR family regulator
MHIKEEVCISDLETLKVLSDSLRVQILKTIGMASDRGQLTTVKQLSEDLDVPQSKLYYHINLLEKHDLIRIANTRVISGIVEKQYQIRARKILVNLDIAKHSDSDRDQGGELTLASIKAMLDLAYANVQKSIRQYQEDSQGLQEENAALFSSQVILQLSGDQASELVNRLNVLINEYTALENAKGIPFALTILFNPNFQNSSQQEIQDSDRSNPFFELLGGIEKKSDHIPPQL